MSSLWTVLGAGSILPRAGYGCSGYALRPHGSAEVTLFDCGPGTIRALGAVGIELASVRRVVLSHYHPDHCLDLFALAFARRNPAFLPKTPLEIVGPTGLAELLERGARLYGARTWLEFDHTVVEEIDPRSGGAGARGLERAEYTLSWAPTQHTPESVAWRVDLRAGGSLTYSGDSGESRDLVELARRCDLFVCECSFPDEQATEHHLTPSSAARLAEEARCSRLLLTHFYPSVDPESARRAASRIFGGPIDVAHDGSRHELG